MLHTLGDGVTPGCTFRLSPDAAPAGFLPVLDTDARGRSRRGDGGVHAGPRRAPSRPALLRSGPTGLDVQPADGARPCTFIDPRSERLQTRRDVHRGVRA